MTLVCITNAIAQLPARARCRIRGQHYDSCNTDTCTGCVPRPANHGLLCWSCWTKLQAAANQLLDPITIQCRNRACGAIYDPQMIEFDLRVYVQELQEKEKSA